MYCVFIIAVAAAKKTNVEDFYWDREWLQVIFKCGEGCKYKKKCWMEPFDYTKEAFESHLEDLKTHRMASSTCPWKPLTEDSDLRQRPVECFSKYGDGPMAPPPFAPPRPIPLHHGPHAKPSALPAYTPPPPEYFVPPPFVPGAPYVPTPPGAPHVPPPPEYRWMPPPPVWQGAMAPPLWPPASDFLQLPIHREQQSGNDRRTRSRSQHQRDDRDRGNASQHQRDDRDRGNAPRLAPRRDDSRRSRRNDEQRDGSRRNDEQRDDARRDDTRHDDARRESRSRRRSRSGGPTGGRGRSGCSGNSYGNRWI